MRKPMPLADADGLPPLLTVSRHFPRVKDTRSAEVAERVMRSVEGLADVEVAVVLRRDVIARKGIEVRLDIFPRPPLTRGGPPLRRNPHPHRPSMRRGYCSLLLLLHGDLRGKGHFERSALHAAAPVDNGMSFLRRGGASSPPAYADAGIPKWHHFALPRATTRGRPYGTPRNAAIFARRSITHGGGLSSSRAWARSASI